MRIVPAQFHVHRFLTSLVGFIFSLLIFLFFLKPGPVVSFLGPISTFSLGSGNEVGSLVPRMATSGEEEWSGSEARNEALKLCLSNVWSL